MSQRSFIAVAVCAIMVLSSLGALGFVASSAAASPTAVTPGSATIAQSSMSVPASTPASPAAPVAAPASAAPTVPVAAPTLDGQPLLTLANDPSYAQFVNNVNTIGANAIAAGLPRADLHMPYTGYIPSQYVNGVMESGNQITAQVPTLAASQTDPVGINYQGQNNTNGGIRYNTIRANSIEGILNVNASSANFYPDSGTPTQWGGQLNVVMPNVTIFGKSTYDFWLQNVISYDTNNQTISFVDDTWNFTSGSSSMQPSSLLAWSPTGGSYTGVWVAFSPYFYCPPPFSVYAYINTSITSGGDQVLWYNYSISSSAGKVSHGTYDYLIFNSQPKTGGPITLHAPYMEASGKTSHSVRETYEFDAFIGADDGAGNLMRVANATMQVKYCSIGENCTPTNFRFSNVPAATNVGSQTGEQTVGIAVNFKGSGPSATAYLSEGPLISHGLWNYTTSAGVNIGNTKVINAITVSGSPVPVATQPYVFVFFQSTNFSSQGFQWAGDVPAWYLMPGTYSYEIMLADYQEQFGNITVGSSTVTLTAVLPYSPASGVYTPLWALNNGQLAGISSSGTGTISSQYVLFNNPTSSCTFCGGAPNNNLSSVFYSSNDYTFSSFPGIYLNNTNVYVDVNAPPSFCVHSSGSTYYYLNIDFFDTSHVTLSNGAAIRGWPAWTEISFYITVPASQNPAPQAEVYVWNSTGDLIMDNNFVTVAPTSGHVAPTELVLYGGSNNVVWGNTFRDPPSVTTMGATYAGIVLAERGDLIYNNNFTVDNPVVDAPYNWANTADCLPQTLGGCANNQPGNAWYYNLFTATWNVTPQAASNVVHTVNGFALSGNVLGPSYTTQGGNFYWNYGRSPNNATGTYVSRFLYTDWSNIFPLGCGTNPPPGQPCATAPPVVAAYENGMNFGSADFAPLTINPIPVTFTETGLPSGASWAVVLDGKLLGTTTSSIAFGNQVQGLHPYQIATVPGYTPTVVSGSISITGQQKSITQAVTFARTGYTVTFTEVGLASGTTWTATLNGTAKTSATSGTTISFTGQLPGTLAFSLTGKAGYLISPMSGTVTVVSSAINIPVTFSKTMFAVTFTETGYSGAWAVALGNVVQSAAAGGPIVFNESNGSYAYKVAMVSGYTAAPSSGTATVAGAAVPEAITYTVAAPPTYSLQFTENGLPSGTMWSVTVTGGGGGTLSSTGTTITFSGLVAGVYTYSYGAVAGYTTPSGSSTTITAASVSIGVVYSAPTYAVTFTESGLPAGTLWGVVLAGQIGTSIGTTIIFHVAAGTYSYSVATTSGYAPTPGSGTLIVSGATPVAVTYTLIPPPPVPTALSASTPVAVSGRSD